MLKTGHLYRDNVSQLIGWGHWLVFFNVLLAMLVASRFLWLAGWPDTPLGSAYLLISWAGHFAFLTFFTYLLTLFPLTFLFPKLRTLQWLAATIATTALTLLLVDSQVFSLFKFHLNPTVWRLLLEQAQTEQASGWGWLFVWVPLLFLFELWLAGWLWRWSQRRRRSPAWPLAVPLLACFFLTHSLHIWADAYVYNPITEQKADFPLSYPMTAKRFLIKQGWLDEDQYKQLSQQVPETRKQQLNYPLRPLEVKAPEVAPNILLIIADGLRADQLDAITMPNLHRFAERHLQFSDHLSGGNQRQNALFSLFYSLPSRYQTQVRQEGTAPLFISELQRQDYRFGLFASGGLEDSVYKEAIFSSLRHSAFNSTEGGAYGDAQTVAEFNSWLAKQDNMRPWFSYVYLDAINDLDIPEGIEGPFQPALAHINPAEPYQKAEREALINRYRNAVFFTDRLLGQLIALPHPLAQQESQRDTLIIITAGHGIEFNDYDNNTWGWGNAYSPAQLQVPLVIAWPGKAQPARFDYPTSQLDLVPTLMRQALGVQSPARSYATGQSLFKEDLDRWRLASDENEYAIYQHADITLFNRRGDMQLLRASDYRQESDDSPELSLLLQVMSDLNRFQGH
ncbi:alkaline phosphatase [Oceanisphaera avium]|uniref:Alkaline phosphatase n=2 Tax=Oceanisphaera avium TaxID=1903694 RepID=A0A1Y0D0B7_9GAMM|nr:alkaline phosphatase [Oceanisphaera avium]